MLYIILALIVIFVFLGDLIEYQGKKYVCVVGQTEDLPDGTPSAWEEPYYFAQDDRLPKKPNEVTKEYVDQQTSGKRQGDKDKSKPAPKIDIKEECVEPVSIWKDVSELPEYFKETAFLWRDLEGNIAIGGYYRDDNCAGGLTSGNIEKKYFCKLTDFINAFEQMQKDINQLKTK